MTTRTTDTDHTAELSLTEERLAFSNRRFLATPLTGMMIWLVIGLTGLLSPVKVAVWTLFIGTGSIAYISILVSNITGENFTDKSRPKNSFDTLFFYSVGMCFLVYAIALPFFIIDFTSLPLTVGILTGLMWLPFSWIINHWIGLFHSISRTLLVVAAWYLIPEYRFSVIPFIIVAVYLVTILTLEKRWRIIINQK